MKVLITGAGGQVGRALVKSAPAAVSVVAAAREDLDISSSAQVNAAIAGSAAEVIINAAAYTAVDRAETEPERAFLVNAQGPRLLAEIAAANRARLIHVSTDFVFDGAACRPYPPDAPTNPLSVYGRSKQQGEQAVVDCRSCASVVVRTAWVYAAYGRNFVSTMLRLMQERGAVRVVADQVGTPTSADSLARALWAFAARPSLHGVYHWTDDGVASWYDFAVAIMEEGRRRGVLSADVEVTAIRTADLPTAAARPAFSVLDKASTISALGYQPQHWRHELRSVIGELTLG